MPRTLDPELRRALAERIRFYNELGVYDFYRRETPIQTHVQSPGMLVPGVYVEDLAQPCTQPELREEMSPRKSAAVAVPAVVEDNMFEVAAAKPEQGVTDPVKALKIIREDLGDCTRCVLHKQGRKQIVFGVGNPKAELMFVGEGPGADEDEQGEPFVGRAGQLLNNMIRAMGLQREEVYIANIVKCRPPNNREPMPEEAQRCAPYLARQIALIKPKIIVAVGRVAAQNLLKTDRPVGTLRGKRFDYDATEIPVIVTYHPAYLLRSPQEKRKAWRDLLFAKETFSYL